MKTLRHLVAAFAVGVTLAWPAYAAQPLLAPAELAPLIGKPEVRVIDIRDPKAYGTQHIVGAVSAPYGQWRGPATNPGELPELSKLTALVRKLGLTPQTHAVVVSSGADATDFGASARVYWTLKVLGLKELSVLNGGVKAWDAAKLPQDAAAVTVAASTYAPTLDQTLIATRDEVKAHVASGKAKLVDARPAEFFAGDTRHQAALVPGTLKGAVNVEHSRWFAPGSSAMLSPAEVAKAAEALPAGEGETVSFCNTGHWAATNWFAMSEVAGRKNVSLYAGSMVDWSRDSAGLPMDNVPGRAKQLWIDAKLWAQRTFQ